MPKLEREHQVYIVHQLARFKSPTRVAKLVKETFDIEVERQHVEHYDPTKHAGQDLSKEFVDLFNEQRAQYTKDLNSNSVFHQKVRMDILEEMIEAERSKATPNKTLISKLLEQAAKEAGGSYTNQHVIATKDDKPLAIAVQAIDYRAAIAPLGPLDPLPTEGGGSGNE
jgi:hypothetical protein